MKVLAGEGQRGPVISAAVALGALFVLVLTVPLGLPIFEVSLLVAALMVGMTAYRVLLRWNVLLALTILVILFVPIKRYALPGNLPFDLELYRLVVAAVIVAWVTSLLIDPRVRLRSSGFEGPVLLVLVASTASLLANPGDSGGSVKELMFLASFFFVFYLIVSVVRRPRHLDLLLKVLVGGATVVASFAVIESRTGYNVFEHLEGVFPLLRGTDIVVDPTMVDTRGGRLRVYASSQSPLALGAALVMMLPFAVYLARRTGRMWWWLAGALLAMGGLSTLTRTSVVMLMPLGLVFLWLRPKETKRFWPALIPLVCAVYFALPGTIGTIRGAFFPEGGLIAEQQKNAGQGGSGRVADLSPAFAEWAEQPLLGQGYGSRETGRENRKAQILDNQWLKTLLETGAIGTFAWAWLFIRFVRRAGAEAKRDDSDRGLLLVAVTASVAAFAVGMYFYDAFSFIQTTFMLFIVLAFGAAALRMPAEEPEPRVRTARRSASALRPAASSTSA